MKPEPDHSGDAALTHAKTTGSIEIVWPERGGKLGLKKQHPRVKEVLRDAIGELLASLCLKNVYPDGMDIHHNYAKQALIKSAEHLGYSDIAKRLRGDKEYVKALASIVSNFILCVQVADRHASLTFSSQHNVSAHSVAM